MVRSNRLKREEDDVADVLYMNDDVSFATI